MADTVAQAVQRERLRCYAAAKAAVEDALSPYAPYLGAAERMILERLAERFEALSQPTPRRGRRRLTESSPIGSPAGGGE